VHGNDLISVEEELQAGATHLVIHRVGHTAQCRSHRCAMIEASPAAYRIFGVCLGHSPWLEVFGGKVVRAARLMHGKVSPVAHDGKGLVQRHAQEFQAGRYHSLIAEPSSIPSVTRITARTAEGRSWACATSRCDRGCAVSSGERLTPDGPILMSNFLKT